jgi:hypothetical protein
MLQVAHVNLDPVILNLVKIKKILLTVITTSKTVIRGQNALLVNTLTRQPNVVKMSVLLDVWIQMKFLAVAYVNRKGEPLKTLAVVKCTTSVRVE